MRIPSTLRKPFSEALRDVVDVLVTRTRDACAAMAAAEDASEPVHQFRITIRRLRAQLEMAAAVTGTRSPARVADRLGQLMKRTNAAREATVQASWLRGQRELKSVPQLSRRGLDLALDDLAQRPVDAPPPSELVAEFEASIEQLGDPNRLVPSGELTYAQALAATLEQYDNRLRRRLAKIATPDDRRAVHRARIAAKRLRYVMEPIRGAIAGSGAAIKKLQQLQDALGNWHDLIELEGRLRASVDRAAQAWTIDLQHAASNGGSLAQLTRTDPAGHGCYALAAAVRHVRQHEHRAHERATRRFLETSEETVHEPVRRVAVLLGSL